MEENMIQKFIQFLNEQVETKAIYVLGAQGQHVVDILPKITDMETTTRVKEILTLISANLKGTKTFDIMTSRAFDCSGLGTYFFLLNDLIDDDTTADGLYKKCKPIPKDQLIAGDMVFQEGTRPDGTKYKNHVGYYDGEGYVVEAKGRSWGVVKGLLSSGSWSHFGRPKFWDNKPSVIVLSRVLKYNKKNPMKGDDVKFVQSVLNEKGFNCGTADGVFGQKTEKAVKAVQRANGLVVDGEVGRNTASALGIDWE